MVGDGATMRDAATTEGDTDAGGKGPESGDISPIQDAGGGGTGLSRGAATDGGMAGSFGVGGAAGSVAVTKNGETQLTNAGLTVVSYGGFMNGESFQQDGVVSYDGYQYAAFWNTSRHVVLARRALPDGAWSKLEFTDYTNTADDAHNTISIGICSGDGTLHLSFDQHGSNLHYRRSVAGFVTNPAATPWVTSSFSAVASSLVGGTIVAQLTYPRFVTEPGGGKMLFEARIGGSGSGDEYLWEYVAAGHSWTSIGRFVNGTANSINAYPHGLSYGKGGTRLHMAWCWRDTPDAATNHDLLYIYSDDNGRTWKNNAGATVATTGSAFVTMGSPGIRVWSIPTNRGLINQEHMAVDADGLVHVLLSHMPDAQPDQVNFDDARSKSQFFHYWRDTDGTWTRNPMGLPVVASFRGKLAISSSGGVYAILPDLRIAAAEPGSRYSSWIVLNTADAGRFFSDPLIDTARLVGEDKLTVVYPQKSAPNIYALDYTLK
jgi:putative BNR repeat neuraminidase